MYKNSDFIVDISNKIAIVNKKFEHKAWNFNVENFKNNLDEIVSVINEIAITELGYRKKLDFQVDYGFEPIGVKDTFTAVIIYFDNLNNTNIYHKFNFKLENGPFIYKDIIKGILEYYERVEKGYKLQANLDEFNVVIAELMQWNAVQTIKDRLDHQLEEESVDFSKVKSQTSISFGISKDPNNIFNTGVDFLDISEKHVVIGLKEEVIMNLDSNAMFDTVFIGRDEAAKKAFAKILDVYVQPYGLIKVNDVRTKDLGIYTREKLYTVMRRSFNTPFYKLERGLGYYETEGSDGIFAIIEKKAVKESEIKKPSDDLIYIENYDITAEEMAQNLNMLEIRFRIYPFYKDTNEPASKTLTEIWNSLKR